MTNVPNTNISVPNTLMERGALVEVEVAGGSLVQRIVWSVGRGVVFVCSAKTYERLLRGESAAQPIGFPVSDVRALA